MSFQRVDAGRGVEWLKQGVELVFKNPVVFLVNAFLFGVIWCIAYLIPLIGWIIAAALAPILAAGMVYAFREQAGGGEARIEHLFRGFQEPGKPVQLGLLGLPSIASGALPPNRSRYDRYRPAHDTATTTSTSAMYASWPRIGTMLTTAPTRQMPNSSKL